MAGKIVDYGYIARTWNALLSICNNEYGIAGLMGNWYSESKIVPYIKQGNVAPPWTSSINYTNRVDSGEISEIEFVNDSIGYGFAQWTSAGRKQNMYNIKRNIGKSIGDFDVGIAMARFELTGSYKNTLNVMQNAISIREASDYILHHYEQPADQSEAVEIVRADYGQQIYNLMHGTSTDYIIISPSNVSINSGESVTFEVSASSDWNVSIGANLTLITQSNNNFTVRADNITSSVQTNVIVRLINGKSSASANIGINAAPESEFLTVTPKEISITSEQFGSFNVDASGDFDVYHLPEVETEIISDRIKVRIRNPTRNYYYIQVFLKNNQSVEQTVGINVKNVTPTGKRKAFFMYTLKKI